MREFRPYGSVRGAPSNGRPYRDLDARGKAYTAKGQYEQAIRNLNEAIRIRPIYRNWYLDRGRAYLASGQREKADADFATYREMQTLRAID